MERRTSNFSPSSPRKKRLIILMRSSAERFCAGHLLPPLENFTRGHVEWNGHVSSHRSLRSIVSSYIARISSFSLFSKISIEIGYLSNYIIKSKHVG